MCTLSEPQRFARTSLASGRPPGPRPRAFPLPLHLTLRPDVCSVHADTWEGNGMGGGPSLSSHFRPQGQGSCDAGEWRAGCGTGLSWGR